MEIAMFSLLFAWLALWATGRVVPPEALKSSWPAWIFLTAWLLLESLHVVPMPETVVAALSPEAARVQSYLTEAGIPASSTTLSVDPHASLVSLMKTLALVAVFFLSLALLNRRPRVSLLARAIVYWGTLISAAAIMLHVTGAKMEYFGMPLSYEDSSKGTFTNRNHFAGYLEMVLALGIGLLIGGLTDRRADSWKKFLRLAIEWLFSPKMILRLALCIVVIAMTTTHSRMGNAAFFSSLLIAGLIGISLSRYATRNTIILLVSLVVIDVAIVGSWFGVDKLVKRIQETTIEDVQEREDPAASTVRLIKDYPIVGAGPGTFYVTFPRYRGEKVYDFFDHAHNDYAEFAAESGLVGLAILAGVVITSLAAAIRAQWLRRDPLMRGMSFACIMGVTAILIHSWVDFNLQIPSNADLFVVLLAIGWISLNLDRRHSGPAGEGPAKVVAA